jgi:transcriptional regulator GlxA family with amidase domain
MIIALMGEDLRQELSVEDLAVSLNLSSSRLRHLFKAETGMSLAPYRKLLRMRKAKELLETTFLNMKQIRFKIGMNDKDYFTKSFKDTYDVTPTEYRARCTSAKLTINRPVAVATAK